MKTYRFLKDFLGMKQGDICEIDDIFISPLLEAGIIEEAKPKPKNRFLLKAEDINQGTPYWYIDSCNEAEDTIWFNKYADIQRLANNNVFLSEAECDAEIARNEAVNKYLKCVARHNEARGFEAKFNSSQENCVFELKSGALTFDIYSHYQHNPIEYYFHEDDAESIRKELGDECLMLVFGGE